MIKREVILFGAGNRLREGLNLLRANSEYKVVGVWDNSKEKNGKIIELEKGRKVRVEYPHFVDDRISIIIIPYKYYDDIKQQLIMLGINLNSIYSYSECFRWHVEELNKKYGDSNDKCIKSSLYNINKYGLKVFNNGIEEDVEKIKSTIEILRDSDSGLLYTVYKEKKLFFKRSMSEDDAKNYLTGIIIEQNVKSPHYYGQSGFEIVADDVVIDAGAAEGLFSIGCIDIAQRIILIESDSEWIEALHHTFLRYKEKVIIIPKDLGKATSEDQVSIDEIRKTYKVTFIKMDIEGSEIDALEGSKEIIESDEKLRMIVCTYHRHDDAEYVSNMLLNNGFMVKYSKGYMVFLSENVVQPEFRHGLVLAKR